MHQARFKNKRVQEIDLKYENEIKPLSVDQGNQILIDTLEQYSNVGGWHLDLITMSFNALGNKVYSIYGIEEQIGQDVDYKKFLFDYVPVEDQIIVEQVRLRLISGESPVSFSHRIIKQDTGEIKLLDSICYTVLSENNEVIGFRGVTMYAEKQPVSCQYDLAKSA